MRLYLRFEKVSQSGSYCFTKAESSISLFENSTSYYYMKKCKFSKRNLFIELHIYLNTKLVMVTTHPEEHQQSTHSFFVCVVTLYML